MQGVQTLLWGRMKSVDISTKISWGGLWDLNPQPSLPQSDALTN